MKLPDTLRHLFKKQPFSKKVSEPLNYVVEKNVQIPDDGRKRAGRKTTYPFERMEVGDSFIVRTHAQSCNARQSARRKGMNILTRATEVDGEKVWRVWRIE
jgi:hypothetical protein